MDNELFELCKEVYEKTGWDDDSLKQSFKQLVNHNANKWKDWFFADYNNHTNNDIEKSVPLYTSDYLLEKLPKLRGEFKQFYLTVEYMAGWWAGYNNDNGGASITSEVADTPLKALLKLTIALYEAGELK